MSSNQEMSGGGLLCLVVQITFSIMFSVTVNTEPGVIDTAEECIEMEDGGTCTVSRAGGDTRASWELILLAVT